MSQPFYKYQGTGNDFIMIDNRSLTFDKTDTKKIESLCDRRFGIGADGLILLEEVDDYDFRMVYFNSDGREGSMCGNGGRCIVQFAYDLRVIKERTSFIAVDGPHEAYLKDGLVHLKMIDVSEVETNGGQYFMNTGSPHFVKSIVDLKSYDVVGEGRKIRNSERFKEKGTNVNFSEFTDNVLFVRTYERGVEDETYSCGTGVTASAIALSFMGANCPIKIKTLGGELSVTFEKNAGTFRNIFLIGPAVKVFEGNF